MPLLVHSTVCIIQELLASSSFHVVIPQRPSTWLMIDGLRLLIATPVGLLWCLIILWIGNTVQLRLLWKYGGTWSLKKRAEIEEDEPLILVYQDEVHFQIQTTVTSGWYKKEVRLQWSLSQVDSKYLTADSSSRKAASFLLPSWKCSIMRQRLTLSAYSSLNTLRQRGTSMLW